MKIRKKTFKINDLKSFELSKKAVYINRDFKTLCSYNHYKTNRLNQIYLNLIFEKIQKLKTTKNRLIKIKSYFSKNKKNIINQDYFKIHNTLKNHFSNTYKELLSLNLIPKETNNQEENINKYFLFSNFILSINESIKQINKAIKHYLKENKSKNKFYEYQINNFDLKQLEKGQITENLKKLSFYSLVTIKKTKIKSYDYLTTKHKHLNDLCINDYLKEYTKTEIIKDFSEIIKPEIKAFTNWFLNKTL